jgi:DNA-binding winged helix-turn-helix (wHTH) protein
MFIQNFTLLNEYNLKKIINVAQRSENATVLWLPGIGRTAVADALQNMTEIKNLFPDKALNNIIFAVLDINISVNFFLIQLEEVLEIYSQKQGIRAKIKDICDNGNQLIFILDNFNFSNPDLIKYIYSLRNVNRQKINFWNFAFTSEFYSNRNEPTRDTIMSHNLIKIGYYTKEESYQWLEINKIKHNVKLNEELKSQIFEFSGGIPALMRCYLRQLANNVNIEIITSSEEMMNIALDIWKRFTDKEKEVLERLELSLNFPPYKYELNYLKEQNVINEYNKINGTWIKLVVKPQESINIILKGELIIWDNLVINEHFTDKEIIILSLLLKNKGKIVSREDIGNEIWGNEANEKYSIWAIDQSISRLRKKLEHIGLPKNLIITNKGKGCTISNNVID